MKPFHETLSSALDTGINYLKENGAEFHEFDLRDKFSDGLRYNTYNESHAEINLLKGKPTKKWCHLTVYRHETGRYEVNSYIL